VADPLADAQPFIEMARASLAALGVQCQALEPSASSGRAVDGIDDELRDVFLEEAGELLPEIERHWLRWRADNSLRDALIVGIAQIGALIPGVSRSGSTLTAALFLNFKREEAARFSFLLGLPAIALAGLKELWVLLHADMPAHAWPHLLFGLVVASVSAFFAIWGLMRFLERFSTWPKELWVLLHADMPAHAWPHLLFGLVVAQAKGAGKRELGTWISELDALPEEIAGVLKNHEAEIKKIASKYAKYDHALYVGRDTLYPAAMESA
jgi:hypothetical protein